MFFGTVDENVKTQLQLGLDEYEQYKIMMDRRFYLTSIILATDEEADGFERERSTIMRMVEDIMEINRYDAKQDTPPKERKPIRLYINSPGGSISEGFSLLSAIELSKTPIYTINIGQWSSMAFLIGISGHKRFSLPHMRFLMHEGYAGAYDSGGKAQDLMRFLDRFEREVVRSHVLKHGKMSAEEYDSKIREEVYMLPEDALEYGFIDEIVTDIDAIL
ncbi:ATP-dependent Clp protease proteolytic subunit [Candidatus Saccharibacteria bacterium]|nr:ATP-dependent Clp protease proteolytic subunit [Candidatus Saccharibacteria bacterium]